jgi:uncharacterized protein (DUF58 family)
MVSTFALNVRQRVSDWVFRARVPEPAPVVLVQRRIFILPSRTGYFFGVVLFLLLLTSVNYSLSLGFLLTFLLAGMGGMSILHTFRNIARLSIAPGRAEPIFAGETAHFALVAKNTGVPRFAVGMKRANVKGAEPIFGDIAQDTTTTFAIPMSSHARGRLNVGRIEIFTEYPVGIFHAWAYVDFGMSCVVYPKPDPAAGPLPIDANRAGPGAVPIAGDDEFQSLRSYKPGDTPRQIAWKALAREQGLLVKEFGALASSDLWLDYESLPSLSVEDRLSRLTWWVLEAERLQRSYGLKLPGKVIAPAQGVTHRTACLTALALYGQDH